MFDIEMMNHVVLRGSLSFDVMTITYNHSLLETIMVKAI